MHKLAAENAASAKSAHRGGHHRHLAIILNSNKYHSLIGAAFMALINPVLVPIITKTACAAAIVA